MTTAPLRQELTRLAAGAGGLGPQLLGVDGVLVGGQSLQRPRQPARRSGLGHRSSVIRSGLRGRGRRLRGAWAPAAAASRWAASCAAACGGRVSGSCSRTGIGSVPRTTTMPRNASSSGAAASGLAGGRAADHARAGTTAGRRRRGSGPGGAPAAAAGWPPGCGGGGAMIVPASSVPNGPSTSSQRAALAGRAASRGPRGRRPRCRPPAARRTPTPAAATPRPAGSRRSTFCCGLSSTRRSIPGSAGSRIDAEVDAGDAVLRARRPRRRGRWSRSTSRSRCCGSGGTPRSRRLRSIRLRRRPNGMSDPPFENRGPSRTRARRWSRARPRRARCRGARRPARSGRAPPAARPAARSGRRGGG